MAIVSKTYEPKCIAPIKSTIAKSLKYLQPLIEIYKGSRDTGEMISFIEKMGFTLVSVSTERWAFPGAADCDALFIRSEEYEYLKSHSKI